MECGGSIRVRDDGRCAPTRARSARRLHAMAVAGANGSPMADDAPRSRWGLNRPGAGSEQASLRPSSRTCERWCGWLPGARKTPAQPVSRVAPCHRLSKAVTAQALREPNAAKAAPSTQQWRRRGSCSPCRSPRPTNTTGPRGEWAEAVQEMTGASVELAEVDAGSTGTEPAKAANEQGMPLEVVTWPEAKRGCVL